MIPLFMFAKKSFDLNAAYASSINFCVHL